MTPLEAPHSAMSHPCQEQEEEQWGQDGSVIKMALVGLSLQQLSLQQEEE